MSLPLNFLYSRRRSAKFLSFPTVQGCLKELDKSGEETRSPKKTDAV